MMRYIVVRPPKKIPFILFWEGERTHPAMAKLKKIRPEQISSVGYITYRRDKNDFFITWHTPYPDEQSPEIAQEDINIIMRHAQEKYGQDESLKKRLADEFEETQRANQEIVKKFFNGR